MKRRAETRQDPQGGSPATAPLGQVLGPLVAGMTATRQSLLEWVHTVGGIALDAVFREEAAGLATHSTQPAAMCSRPSDRGTPSTPAARLGQLAIWAA